MADHVREFHDGDASLELFDYEGVTQVVDLGSFDTSNTKVAVDGSSDIADQERIACFSDKKGGILGFGSFTYVFFDGGFGSLVQGYFPGIVRLIGSDFEM